LLQYSFVIFIKKRILKLLIVEDEQDLRDNIESYFTGEGNICESCRDLRSAMDKVAVYQYDCILLDLGLPDGEGFTLLNHLKLSHKNEGVLILSARNSIDDKVRGLNDGADDYLIKPFHLSELKARVEAIYRRKTFNGDKILNYDQIAINLVGREVTINQTPIDLTRKEYDLLLYFIANKGKRISRNAIAEHLWGDEIDMADNFDFIYTHIKNLRKKLADVTAKDYIKSIYGVGYKFF
jgi:DNA-binding response OmpR family regulator